MLKLIVCACAYIMSIPFVMDAACIERKCESKRGRYKTCSINQIPDDHHITSVTIEEEKSFYMCTFNITYGYSSKKIWVDKGCRAEFDVCFSGLESTTSRVTHTTWSPVTSSIQSVTNDQENTTQLGNNGLQDGYYSIFSIAGIVGGVLTGVVIVIIMVVIVVVVQRRFSSKMNNNDESTSYTNFSANENPTYSMQNQMNLQNETRYEILGSQTECHHYNHLTNIGSDDILNNPHSYMAVYDSIDMTRPTIEPEVERDMRIYNATYEKTNTPTEMIDYAYEDHGLRNNVIYANTMDNRNLSVNENESSMSASAANSGLALRDGEIHVINDMDYELARPISDVSNDTNTYDMPREGHSNKTDTSDDPAKFDDHNTDNYDIPGDNYYNETVA